MVQQLDITVSLTEEQRAQLDEARGSADIAAFLRDTTLRYVEQTQVDDELDYEDDNLSPEDHMRLADAAESDSIDIEELGRRIDAKIAQ